MLRCSSGSGWVPELEPSDDGRTETTTNSLETSNRGVRSGWGLSQSDEDAYPRWGVPRLHWRRGREGLRVNCKRVERLYRHEELAVRRRHR
jgi:hypothetical protein